MLLFSLFMLFLVAAVQFGKCEDSTDCTNITSAPGSDETKLSKLEMILEELKAYVPSNRLDKNKTSFGEVLESMAAEVHIIAPGTLWCGSGDIAKHESDLGYFNNTDACCRAHDNCKNNLLVGKTEANIKNNGIFTRSACVCDFEFYDCLKSVNSWPAKMIGKTYFNTLQPQCFHCKCPAPDCIKTDGTECKNHCKKYIWINSKKF